MSVILCFGGSHMKAMELPPARFLPSCGKFIADEWTALGGDMRF